MPSVTLLLDAALKATVILTAASLVALSMRRSSAASRYLLWTCALFAVLAVPVLSLWLPHWSVSVDRPVSSVLAAPPAVAAESSVPATEARTPPAGTRTWPVGIWLAGALIVLTRLALGHLRLRLAWRRARKAPHLDWIPLLEETLDSIRLTRAVRLRLSSETDVPLTWGILSAAILLPEAAAEWDAERRRVVLLHELTHVRRMDPLLYLVAQIALAIYWFHPLAWLAAARFRREQERSCDDAVLRAGAGRSAYAQHLVELARSMTPEHAYSAALGMAERCDLEQRVRALLDPRSNRRALSGAACLAGVAVLLAAVIPLAALHAQGSKPVASISGSVYDASGAAIPHARIVLENVDGSNTEAAQTNDAGEYHLSAVPAANYNLHAGAPGLAEFRKTIVLASGDALKLNITLDVGQVTEAMEVVGKGPRPPQVAAPHRIRVGGNVQATKLTSMAKPAYPPSAQAAGIEGTVLLRAVISIRGDLLNLSVMNTSVDPELARAALDAVKQWHYQPTLLNGEPVEVVTTIAVTFRLES